MDLKTFHFTDPEFTPEVSMNETHRADHRGEIQWSPPPAEFEEYVHFYRITMVYGEEKTSHDVPAPATSYVTPYLQPGIEYSIRVAACSDYTEKCGESSKPQTIELNENITGIFDSSTPGTIPSLND